MGNDTAISLSKDVPFGELKFILSSEEVAILKLISCEKNEALGHWEQLWKRTKDYEDLLFSCKELMPSAVKKIQLCCEDSQWQSFIPGNAQFLAGLPRFSWTKNQYIINEYQKIARALEKEQIEFIALKGVCEMLDGTVLSYMRTSRDIDILIHEKDDSACRVVFEKLGWIKKTDESQVRYLNNPIKSHAETYQREDRIFELDVHFTAITGVKSDSRKFTNVLWQRKVKAKNYPKCYIPSLEDRYLITVGNAFYLRNWDQSHLTKYICDLLTLSKAIDRGHLKKITEDAEELMGMGRSVEQANRLVQLLKSPGQSQNAEKQFRLNYSVSQRYLKRITRILISIQLVKAARKRNQILHVIVYFTSRVFSRLLLIARNNRFTKPEGRADHQNHSGYKKQNFKLHLFPMNS